MKKLLFLLIIAALCLDQALAQSAWNRDKGAGFFKLSESVIISNDFYDRNGDVVPIKTAGVYITSIYGEYGFSDDLTGFVYVPFFFRNTINAQKQLNSGVTEPGDESNSVGDSNIGISYGLFQKGSFVLNTSLAFGLPVGETSGGETGVLQSGDGEFNQLLKVNAGYSFYPTPFYATASIGFNNRTKNFSDELHLSFEAGITFLQKLTVSLKVYQLHSLENGDKQPSQTGVFSNNLEYLAIGPQVNYNYNQIWGISLVFRGAASGQSILASPSYSFGINYRF